MQAWAMKIHVRVARFALAAIVAMLVAACATTPGASMPLTKITSRELPAAAVTGMVMDQVSQILIFDQPSSSRAHPPTLPLDDASFFTRPRATGIPDLCTSERLIV